MRLVLRIGGSVIASPVDAAMIRKYVDLLKNLKRQGHEVAVVVGGGSLARELISVVKNLRLDERVQDEVAISVSRILAKIFVEGLGELSCETVPITIEDAAKCFDDSRVAVMGGLRPGMTTDTVAALICEQLNADLLVKATDQEGIYNKDPKKHVDAVKLESLSYKDLSNVFDEDRHRAGIHQVLDPVAVEILERKQLRVVIVNGFKPENVSAAVEGEKVGTQIA